MAKLTVVLVANGFEEVEAVTPMDLLRRAGIPVRVLAVGAGGGLTVTGSHGIKLLADDDLSSLDEIPSCVVLPGGMPGAKNLRESALVKDLIEKTYQQGGLIAAICASPAEVLAPLGILKEHEFTCYPGCEERVNSGTFLPDRVVVSGTIVTSRGPGTAAEFSLEIIRILAGQETAEKVRAGTLQPV